MNVLVCLFSLILSFTLLGCKQDSISTYKVPKDAPKEFKTAWAQDMGLSWSAPDHWKPGPASGMRLGSYVVERHSHTSEVTIISLPGNSGSLLANINRWRGQVGLGSIESKDLSSITETISIRGKDITFVTLHGTNGSIHAALFKLKNSTVFVKHSGDKHTIDEESVIFEGFVRGLRFD